MDYATESLKLHEQLRGKIEIVSRAKVDSKEVPGEQRILTV